MDNNERESPALRRQYLDWRHGAANLGYVALMHGALLAWLWYGRGLLPYPAFLALSVLACVIHQRILSEWFHEATHWNLVPDRGWNDALANLLIAPLNGIPVRSNRPGHFRHHAVTEFFTAADPDTRGFAAANRAGLRRGLLRDLTGVTAWQTFIGAARGDNDAGPRSSAPGVAWFAWLAVLHGAGFTFCALNGRWDIYPLYFLTLLSLYPVANRFRLYVQHARLEPDGAARLIGSPTSRSFHAGLAEQLLLQSPMIMYHYQHHAWPSLPYRALRALSRRESDLNRFGDSGLRLMGVVTRGLPR